MDTAIVERDATASLQDSVKNAINSYLNHIGDGPINDLYDLVLGQVELPLLTTVLREMKYNQSRAAEVLGLSRGTLRKKLRELGIIE